MFPSNCKLTQLVNLFFNDSITKNELSVPPATIFTTAVVQMDALQKGEPRAHKDLTERSPTQCPCKCLAVTQLLGDSGILLPL